MAKWYVVLSHPEHGFPVRGLHLVGDRMEITHLAEATPMEHDQARHVLLRWTSSYAVSGWRPRAIAEPAFTSLRISEELEQ